MPHGKHAIRKLMDYFEPLVSQGGVFNIWTTVAIPSKILLIEAHKIFYEVMEYMGNLLKYLDFYAYNAWLIAKPFKLYPIIYFSCVHCLQNNSRANVTFPLHVVSIYLFIWRELFVKTILLFRMVCWTLS